MLHQYSGLWHRRVRNRHLFMYLFCLPASPVSPEGISLPGTREGSLHWQQGKRHGKALQQHVPEARQEAYQAQLLSHAAAGNPLELASPCDADIPSLHSSPVGLSNLSKVLLRGVGGDQERIWYTAALPSQG